MGVMIEQRDADKQNRNGTLLPRVFTAGALFLLALVYVAVPPVHRAVSGWTMALTQRSVQSVAGSALQAGAFAPLKAVWLSAFQAFALPWLAPYSVGGNVLAFGRLFGAMISLFGALLGASAWFGLTRLFIGNGLRGTLLARRNLGFWEGYALAAALNWLTIGMLSLCGAIFGVTREKFGRYLLCAAVAHLPIEVLYALYCNPYRALLPNAMESAIRILGALAAIGFIINRWIRAVRKPPTVDDSRQKVKRG